MTIIKEIAEMAGVSMTTVYNVLHGNVKKVSKANMEKIQALLDEYHYVPKMGLRALKNNSLILFLVSSAAIKSTSFNVLIARNVISSRLPIGVATKYNVPAIFISHEQLPLSFSLFRIISVLLQ